MKPLYTWSAIAMVVVASTAGDILLAKAMRQIGDLGELRQKKVSSPWLPGYLAARRFCWPCSS